MLFRMRDVRVDSVDECHHDVLTAVVIVVELGR